MADQYSPSRRTALVLTGTGADGAYHAGVLRALHEAGIKIDIVAGRGIGAVSAVFAAVDGTGRLWEASGLWRDPAVAGLYRWRWPIRVIRGLLLALGAILASPLLLLAAAIAVYVVGLVLGMAGLAAGGVLMADFGALLAFLFAPAALPTWLPRAITLAVLLTLATLTLGGWWAWRRAPLRRRSEGAAWAILGAPLDTSRAARHFVTGLWDLLKGGAALKTPDAPDLSRRYTELLNDNLNQPGFAEVLIVVHDLDARRDIVFGLVREPFRRALFPATGGAAARRAEAFDLAGLARDHLVDVLRAALTIPGFGEAPLVRFASDSYWRGESHRFVDRPGSLGRLLEEAAAAGAEQVIVVSASPEPPDPHELARPRLAPRSRVSELTAGLEAATLRDALHHLHHRFRGVYQIRPLHNPVGPLDCGGAYDPRSDRHHSLAESIERGYEDAYHVFIEPVVAASGEHLHADAARAGDTDDSY